MQAHRCLFRSRTAQPRVIDILCILLFTIIANHCSSPMENMVNMVNSEIENVESSSLCRSTVAMRLFKFKVANHCQSILIPLRNSRTQL